MAMSTVLIVIAVAALLLGGFAKGLSGMGLPVIATPIFALLFDLQTAIAVVILSTLATDVIFLWKTRKNWSLLKQAAILIGFGMCGTVLGSYLLVNVNQLFLSGVLGIVILVYVATSLFSLLPPIKRASWLDAAVGLVGGTFQGSSGACGPIISMYMLQMKLSRNDFLFLINCFFVFIDLIQLIAVYRLGLYEGSVKFYALGAMVPALSGLALALLLHKRISDQVFRYSVLAVMTISAAVLLVKSSEFFL